MLKVVSDDAGETESLTLCQTLQSYSQIHGVGYYSYGASGRPHVGQKEGCRT